MIYTSYKKINEVGRIVISKDIRKRLDLGINELLKIDVEDNKIVITKAEPNCIFCGNGKDLKNYMGKSVCADCIKMLIK